MVSDHEQIHIANLVADTPEDKRVERRADQGVLNIHDGYVAEFGDPDRLIWRDPVAIASLSQPRPHHSRRGGRAFPEVDEPEFRVPTFHQSNPEAQETDLEGLELTRQLVRGLDLRRAALSGNPTETRRVLAMQRARDERRGR